MAHTIRVLVVDDHFVVRKGVRGLLADAEDIAVVGEAGDGEEAVAEARRLRPQVILMDLGLPGLDGVAATRVIVAERPETAVVILSGLDREDQVLDAVAAGALGFLAKTSSPEEFREAIRWVAQGDVWLPVRFTRLLASRLRPHPAPDLTGRERQVLGMLARGWSNRRISQELAIAEITVRSHVSHVFGKLGVRNRVEAALHAMRSGQAGPPGS